jgi:hypothetical protein
MSTFCLAKLKKNDKSLSWVAKLLMLAVFSFSNEFFAGDALHQNRK